MAQYHVTLTRTEHFDADVEARDEDTAVNHAIMQAPGDPATWEISNVAVTGGTALSDPTNVGFKIFD